MAISQKSIKPRGVRLNKKNRPGAKRARNMRRKLLLVCQPFKFNAVGQAQGQKLFRSIAATASAHRLIRVRDLVKLDVVYVSSGGILTNAHLRLLRRICTYNR